MKTPLTVYAIAAGTAASTTAYALVHLVPEEQRMLVYIGLVAVFTMTFSVAWAKGDGK